MGAKPTTPGTVKEAAAERGMTPEAMIEQDFIESGMSAFDTAIRTGFSPASITNYLKRAGWRYDRDSRVWEKGA